ncbi:MAG: hypothetical protein ACOVP8_00330 [Phycisphaerales bacterium]
MLRTSIASRVTLAAVVAVVACCLVQAQTPIIPTSPTGACMPALADQAGSTWTFDLNPLTRVNGEPDLTAFDPTTMSTFDINICSVATNNPNCTENNGMICMSPLNPPPSYTPNVITQWIPQYIMPVWSLNDASDASQGVTFYQDNGDPCKSGGLEYRRRCFITFICDPMAGVVPFNNVSVSISSTSDCDVTFTVPTSAVCSPTCTSGPCAATKHPHHGLSGGSVFVIIFFVTLAVYLFLGFGVRISKGYRGGDACPNGDFWAALPTLVTDGCRYSWHLLTSLCRSNNHSAAARSHSGYRDF